MTATCPECNGFGTITLARDTGVIGTGYFFEEVCPECDGAAEVEVLCPCCDEPVDERGFCKSCREPTVPYTPISFDTDPETKRPRFAA